MTTETRGSLPIQQANPAEDIRKPAFIGVLAQRAFIAAACNRLAFVLMGQVVLDFFREIRDPVEAHDLFVELVIGFEVIGAGRQQKTTATWHLKVPSFDLVGIWSG